MMQPDVEIYILYLYADDSDSEEEADKSNRCVLVWEVR